MTETEFQKAVLSEFKDVKSEIQAVNERVVSLDQKIEKFTADQQNDVVAMLRVLNDKIATKEDNASITAIIKILSTRSIQHEAEIERIKQAL